MLGPPSAHDPPPGLRTAPVAAQQIKQAVKPACWYAYIAPESYTVQCNNGFWTTYMADGTQVTGNGVIDPNARAATRT